MNSFGRIFRVHIFGESHGEMVGVMIDGCPPGIKINPDDFLMDIERRKPGIKGTTTRAEEDSINIASGIFNSNTTGAPILLYFHNKNTRSVDYEGFRVTPRPGHADFVSMKKSKGFADYSGGGHFSGRLTLGLVAAGVIAKKIIKELSINATLIEAGGKRNFDEAIDETIKNNDSIGGIIECIVSGIPVGWGEPFFDSIESIISHIVFSIPAIKGIEFGSGFKAAQMFGSEHNDMFADITGKTSTNNAGGINGGITNGNDLVFRVAVKPTSSIAKPQETINLETGMKDIIKVGGRHDACIALRMPVIIEAVAAIALADFYAVSKAFNIPAP